MNLPVSSARHRDTVNGTRALPRGLRLDAIPAFQARMDVQPWLDHVELFCDAHGVDDPSHVTVLRL